MSASIDRVRFFLPGKYFSSAAGLGTNSMRRGTCKGILLRAFGMDNGESERMIQGNSYGFTVVCRPSQFARFIVYRYEADECINEIKDLRPEFVPKTDVYDRVAWVTGVDRDAVKLVMIAIDYGTGLPPRCTENVVDVSGNFRGY